MRVLCITGIIGVKVVVDATVGVNDRADWIGVEREQDWSKDRALGYSIMELDRMAITNVYILLFRSAIYKSSYDI